MNQLYSKIVLKSISMSLICFSSGAYAAMSHHPVTQPSSTLSVNTRMLAMNDSKTLPQPLKTQVHSHDHQWKFGVKYQHMQMTGLLDGTHYVSRRDVFKRGYLVSPTQMSMNMTMFSMMYMPTMRWHFMLMLPYLDKSMDHQNKKGVKFTTNAKGIGDFKALTQYVMLKNNTQNLSARLGVSLPTGSINERDNTPLGPQRLPYPMQLGSGTVDPLIGLKYTQMFSAWLWGLEGNAVFHLGKNSHHYAFGNQYAVGMWLRRQLASWINVCVRMNESVWGNVRGADPQLKPAEVPTADPNLQGGNRLDLSLGLSLYGQQGIWRGQRLALVFGKPLYQNLNGPQMRTTWFGGVEWTVSV